MTDGIARQASTFGLSTRVFEAPMMLCRVQPTHPPCAVQFIKPRSARNCTTSHAACRPVPGAESRLLENRVLPTLMAACVLTFWAAVAEPGKAPDASQGLSGWSQQPFTQQTAMMYHPARLANPLRQLTVLIEDDMDAGGDELVIPQSPNPGTRMLHPTAIGDGVVCASA